MPYDESVRCPSLPLSVHVVDSARLMSRCAPRPVRSRANNAVVIAVTAMSPPIGIATTTWGCHGNAGLIPASIPECAK